MDWAKAKSILIVAFLITNLFLGYNVLKDSEIRNYAYTVNDKRINDVRELFQQKNIAIKANMQEKMRKLPQLTVEYETYDRELIEGEFPGFTSISEEAIRYKKDNEIVEVASHNKSISYKNKNKSSTVVEMDEKKAEKVAEDFIKKHGFQGDDVEFWSIKKKHEDYEIVYKQRYEDLILDHGYMKLTVKNGEVFTFEKRWLKPLNVKEFDKEIIPVTKALILAMDDLKQKKENDDNELIIEDIRLAFKLDVFEHRDIFSEEWYEINESTGTGSLFWIIRLADQDDISIKAETYE